MKFRNMKLREQFYFTIHNICRFIVFVSCKIGDWTSEKFNKSYFDIN